MEREQEDVTDQRWIGVCKRCTSINDNIKDTKRNKNTDRKRKEAQSWSETVRKIGKYKTVDMEYNETLTQGCKTLKSKSWFPVLHMYKAFRDVNFAISTRGSGECV